MPSLIPHTCDLPSALYGFLPVHVELLRHLVAAPVDIFYQTQRGHRPSLYCRAGLSLHNVRLATLAEVGVRDVYVRSEDVQEFGSKLLEAVEELQRHASVPAADRFAALQIAVAVEIEHAMSSVDSGRLVTLSRKCGTDLVALVATSKVLPLDLFRLARHDFNTFTHVTNVAGYCLILAQRMGICGREDLERIATGAMLHDIGKRFIPLSVLTKRGRLQPTERELIESHPIRGYEELCDRAELNSAQLMMVYQHHEHLDGNGYPVGVKEADIHPWARMLAVVDVFDAVTGSRPYRRRCSANDALKYIQLQSGAQFDPEIAQCWISAMNEV